MPYLFLGFITYFLEAAALLALFVWIYTWLTPYKDFELVAENNNAAAIALGGAVIGFTLPLAASIYYSRSLIEMAMWAAVTCLVQLAVFIAMRHRVRGIQEGATAPAIVLAAFSIAFGLINAVCISPT